EGHYTFVMNDCGYNTNTNARFFVCRTTNAPVTVTRSNEVVNPDGSVTISITTSAVKSAEEFILIRYVSGVSSDFSGATATNVVQATGSGTNYVATIPAPNTSTTFKYYVFTSTLDATALNGQSELNKSLGTIRYDDNAGSNYTTAVTLPVYLQLFSGSIQNNKIQLRWKTFFEQNVEKFDVEKLVNTQWVTIGSVNAINASTGSEYAYTDGQINHSNIYRLKIVDKSGAVNFSATLSIQNANLTNHQLRIYPTVVSDRSVTIELNKQNAGNVAIKLFSEDGKLLTIQNINFATGFNNYRMNIPTSITKGNYFIQIITEGLAKTSTIMVR
ncbi:MAG: T9SS type A sorting domain-containing protein, partial [Chitinophagaceae bacterium]